jgi:hypothetical protein
MKIITTALIAAVIGFGIAYFLPGGNSTGNMGKEEANQEMDNDKMKEDETKEGMMNDIDARFPPVKGFTAGEEIFFIHSAASDKKIAGILDEMMKSPVMFVPSLAQIPEESLADVYVFDNGIEGMGPLGFQPDIMDNPPGTEGYRPLRSLNIVTWKDEGSARVLKSAAELKEAKEAGEITIKEPGVVINMPMLTWPGGQR